MLTAVAAFIVSVWRVLVETTRHPILAVAALILISSSDLLFKTAIFIFKSRRWLLDLLKAASESLLQCEDLVICAYRDAQFMFQKNTLVVLWKMLPTEYTAAGYAYAAGWVIVAYLVFNMLRTFLREFREELRVAVANAKVGAERVMPGSNFEVNTPSPRFQAEVWTDSFDSAELIRRGQCFRAGNILFTAQHVLDCSRVAVIVFEGKKIQLKTEEFKQDFGSDVAMITLTPEQWSTLGMQAGRLQSKAPNGGAWVRVSAFGQSSYGIIKSDQAFGMVTYTGSTIGGFSGAPYYMNKCIFGMHVGAGDQNVGYDAAYLACLKTTVERDYKPEDTGDFLERMIESEEDIEWEYSPMDSSEVFVRARGQYVRTDVETFDRIRGRDRVKQKKSSATYTGEDARTETASFLGARHPEEVAEVPLVPKEFVAKAEELPPMPRAEMTYPDNPIAGAFASPQAGQQMGQPDVQLLSVLQSLGVVLESLKPTKNSVTSPPVSTPAAQNGPSTTITPNIKRQQKRLRLKENQLSDRERQTALMQEMSQMLKGVSLQLSNGFGHGGSISTQPATSTVGSITSSTLH